MSLTVRYRLPRRTRTADSGPVSPHVASGGAGSPVSSTRPKTTRLARQLALAYLVDRLIEAGTLKNLAEAARRLGICRSRMTQIANLRWLPTEVQEGILDGTIMNTERDLRG